MNRMLRIVSLLVALVLVLSVTACQPAPTAVPVEIPQSKATEVPAAEPTKVTQTEPAVLKVWDQAARPEDSAIMDSIIQKYEAAHPTIKVVREAKTLDDLKATLPLAMSDSNGPCVSMINQGQSDMGAMVAAGLLLPLDDYAKTYDWYKNFPASLVALNSWTEDGKQMGQGHLYGLPNTAEIVGVYYRKDIFSKYELAVPQTYAEFEELMGTLKQKGETPLVFGGLDGWPTLHLFSEIQNAQLAEREWYDNFMYATGKVTFENPANLEAAKQLQGWAKNGYLTKGYEGIGYDDSWQLFSAGEGAMMLTGNWLATDLLAGPNGANLGFFLVPPVEAGGYKLSAGGTGAGYSISAKCANPDEAADYINYLFSAETAERLWAVGTLPVYPVDASKLEDGLRKDIITAWVSANKSNSIGYYFDWVTPTMYDTATASMQELMAGKITPEEFVTKLNLDYVKFLESKK